MRTTPLHDMHCHLAFIENGEEVAAEALAAGTLLFANTVTPDEYRAARLRFASFDNVTVGFGMHPWWVSDNRDLIPDLCDLNPSIIGEIGLDFGRRHAHTREQQLHAFETIVRWASERGGKIISLHSVHATAEVMDLLQSSGTLKSCTCIFHWFTGPSDLLKRAIGAGCFFSVGPRMLATGKGREYVKAIPAHQLLLETDAPPKQGQRYSFAALNGELEAAATEVARIKGESTLETINCTTRMLLQEA